MQRDSKSKWETHKSKYAIDPWGIALRDMRKQEKQSGKQDAPDLSAMLKASGWQG